MCIVIDLNTVHSVFNPASSLHLEFLPVKEWIDKKQGFLVFGGTKYIDELKKAYRYLKLIRTLKDAGKAIQIKTDLVDKEEAKIINMTKNSDCDDQHIIALLSVSNCRLFCSMDARAFEFIKNKKFFPAKTPKVKIYSSKTNKTLLKPICKSTLRNADSC